MSCALPPKNNVQLQQQSCAAAPRPSGASGSPQQFCKNATGLNKNPPLALPKIETPKAMKPIDGSAKNSFAPADESTSPSKPFACEFRGDRPHTPFSLAPNTFEKLCGPLVNA